MCVTTTNLEVPTLAPGFAWLTFLATPASLSASWLEQHSAWEEKPTHVTYKGLGLGDDKQPPPTSPSCCWSIFAPSRLATFFHFSPPLACPTSPLPSKSSSLWNCLARLCPWPLFSGQLAFTLVSRITNASYLLESSPSPRVLSGPGGAVLPSGPRFLSWNRNGGQPDTQHRKGSVKREVCGDKGTHRGEQTDRETPPSSSIMSRVLANC